MARTENDTWDLASSVGVTATAVAAQRAIASQGPDALLNDPWADPLVRAVGTETFIKLLDSPLDRSDDPLLNRQAVKEQITVRTRFFDDFFLQATGSGIRQAVILASGLDTRAYRLAWPAGTIVYEIDQPEVIEFKTRTLAGLGAAPGAGGGRFRSTCETIGRRRSRMPDSTPHNRPPGAPRACSSTCRPRRKTACSTTSPPRRRPAAGSPQNTWTCARFRRIGHRS